MIEHGILLHISNSRHLICWKTKSTPSPPIGANYLSDFQLAGPKWIVGWVQFLLAHPSSLTLRIRHSAWSILNVKFSTFLCFINRLNTPTSDPKTSCHWRVAPNDPLIKKTSCHQHVAPNDPLIKNVTSLTGCPKWPSDWKMSRHSPVASKGLIKKRHVTHMVPRRPWLKSVMSLTWCLKGPD